MIAPLIYLNIGKWKEGELMGGLLPALSMLLVAYDTFEHSFPKKTYPCMRWSTKWKSPWDKALNTVNGTERQAERSSSVSWKKFKTSPLRLHYCRHRSRSGGRPTVTVQLVCVGSADVIYSLFSALLCWQAASGTQQIMHAAQAHHERLLRSEGPFFTSSGLCDRFLSLPLTPK